MTATDKKAALSREWSKKGRPFLGKEMWQKFCAGLSNKREMVISHADGIAVLSGIHEAIYDFTHALSHERVIDLPSKANTDIFSVFKSALKAVSFTTESAAVRTDYEQLLTKICRTRVKVFLQAI